jgi:diadenylate cyclase
MDLLAKALDINSYLSLFARGDTWTIIRAVIEAIVLAYAMLWAWGRVRGSQADRIVKGVLIVVAFGIVSWLLGFTLITYLYQQLLPVWILALLVLFQPEVRRGLGYLGRGKGFRFDLNLSDSQRDKATMVMEQVINAVRELARTKTGALIVIEPIGGERDYLSPGIPVNADVSSNLLLSIFFPNSPLHDGAVIIRGDKLVAAGVILPMTDNPKISYRYGTRHRAAIGLSEIYDALCIVVSEETGFISAASRGMLVRYSSADELTAPLSYIYTPGPDFGRQGRLRSFHALFGRPPADMGTAPGGKIQALEEHRPQKINAAPDPTLEPQKIKESQLPINPKIEQELVD